MKIKYEVKKDVDPKVIEKYRLKMFKKRRKGLDFSVGEVVKLVPENIEYVSERSRDNTKWYLEYDNKKHGWEEAKPVYLKTGVIQYISKTKIKLVELSYWHPKQLFEKI